MYFSIRVSQAPDQVTYSRMLSVPMSQQQQQVGGGQLPPGMTGGNAPMSVGGVSGGPGVGAPQMYAAAGGVGVVSSGESAIPQAQQMMVI